MEFPVERTAFAKTIRLITTARLRDSVLRLLTQNESLLDDLAEIEGATSARLQAQQDGGTEIEPHELVAAVPHSTFINAAFTYTRPDTLNRFNGPERGAWYAALSTDTCLAEVTYHMTRELSNVDNFNACIDYSELFASFAGEFVDLREVKPKPDCLHQDTKIGYPAGHNLAKRTRAAGYNGIIYPSVRHKGGTCIAALQPKAVQSVTQGAIIRVTWSGNAEPDIEWNPKAA